MEPMNPNMIRDLVMRERELAGMLQRAGRFFTADGAAETVICTPARLDISARRTESAASGSTSQIS